MYFSKIGYAKKMFKGTSFPEFFENSSSEKFGWIDLDV
jgi:hypothetical protein